MVELTIKPIKRIVFVLQDELETVTASGIILNPIGGDHLKPNRGTIMAVGPLVEGLKVGDKVMFSMYAGARFNYEKVDYLRMSEDEVFGTFDPDVKVDVGDTRDVEGMKQQMESAFSQQTGK